MITKLSLTERCYLSPGLMAAAQQKSYLLLHKPTPWCRIALYVAGAIIVLVAVIRVVTS